MRPERFTWQEGDIELVSDGSDEEGDDTADGVDSDVDNDKGASEPNEE